MKIFISVGTQKFPFNRLIQIGDRLAEADPSFEVFAQSGNSDYIPSHYRSVSFMDKKEYEDKIDQCDILLTHGGVATIITALKKKKAVIVVPRLSKYGEHVDDHQVQIADSFAEMNYVMELNEDDDPVEMIRQCANHTFETYESHNDAVISTIREFLRTIEAR